MWTTGQARRALTWLALAASLSAGALVVGMRVALPSDGARVAFYGDGWSAGGVRIAPIDDPAPGLLAGDVVVAVDGRSLDAWAASALDPLAARPAVGTPAGYRILRDGEIVAAAIPWQPPSIGAALLEGWSVLLFSIAVAGVAAFVYRRRPDEPAATALMIGACGAAGSSLPWFLGITVSDVVRGTPFLVHALVTGPLYMVLWPSGLHLACVFPTPLGVVRRRPAVIPLLYGAGLAAYAGLSVATALTSRSTLAWIGTWPTVQVVLVVPILAASGILFAWRYRRTTEPAARDRIRWATLGLLLSTLLGLGLFMLPELLLQSPLIPDAAIGIVALPLPLGVAAGILRNRLFDIDAALNRTLVYGGLTLGVLVTYVLVASAITTLIGSATAFGASLLSTGVAALVALPLRDGLQRAVNRLLYGQRDEPWRAMRRLGMRLEWAAEPSLAFPAIAETVADALRAPYVAVEAADEVGRSTVVAEHGEPGTAMHAVPLVHGGQPVGRLVLGIRSGERGFRDDELAFLRDLARQAGAAVHALRLRDDLARSRERLVVTREEERRRLRRDLHDGLGPALAAIGMRAETSAEMLDDDPDAARAQLAALASEVQGALMDIRRLVDGLRPPALDELGLVGAIRREAGRLDGGDPPHAGGLPGDAGPGPAIDHRPRTRIEVESRPVPLPELPAAVEVAAFRIAVEAMTNAVRHAGARSCRVRVEAGLQVLVEVVDDGSGIAPGRPQGTGLESMRERAEELGGALSIEPRLEGGTRVVAQLPIGHPSPG